MEDHPALVYLYDLAEGDMDFVNEILGLMEKNIPLDMADIEKAVATGNLKQVQRSAHHMKSSIQYSNYIDLSELLAAIETKKESATALAEIQDSLPQLKKMADKLLQLIEAEKKKLK